MENVGTSRQRLRQGRAGEGDLEKLFTTGKTHKTNRQEVLAQPQQTFGTSLHVFHHFYS